MDPSADGKFLARVDVDHYVSTGHDGPDGPRYINLPAGILSPGATRNSNSFLRDLLRDARLITDPEVDFLLQPGRKFGPWRDRLVASYLVAIDRRVKYRESIGELLLSNEVGYVAQGYCFALAAFGEDRDADILTAYLDRNLVRTELRIDQSWALAALKYMDRGVEGGRADRFLKDGSWDRWKRAVYGEADLALHVEAIAKLCSLSCSDVE
ncbi:DUF6000 family protein [Actinoplanes sp. NBRC 101535]|uniref:DUF6000 family protein n=1 Tax=Actinoplanes sp. NBRC 101535 TaxID=3032196 RepID=UPI0024A1D30A|nr:DUF6000 family protein [Actinoplanes sp. NBRC 101535]GLY02645.1 hypothetical protein Acsp01_30240 [Actinoplanes sp. NBRC 101535]